MQKSSGIQVYVYVKGWMYYVRRKRINAVLILDITLHLNDKWPGGFWDIELMIFWQINKFVGNPCALLLLHGIKGMLCAVPNSTWSICRQWFLTLKYFTLSLQCL